MAAQHPDINLRNPGLAAFLAWLWPGAGHMYQGRYAKGVLFMVCVLSTYFFGLAIGGGHVVYASWQPNDRRWQYACQVAVGAPALPAIVQNYRTRNGMQPLGDYMAPPTRPGAPGEDPHIVNPGGPDLLASWHHKLHAFFELGTLYTVVAGLLNILAIYDAYAGPAPPPSSERAPPPKKLTKKEANPPEDHRYNPPETASDAKDPGGGGSSEDEPTAKKD